MDAFDVTPTALAALLALLDGLPEDELDRPTPCPDFTVGQVIEHLHLAMTRWAARVDTTLDPADDLPSLVAATLTAWRRRGLDGTIDIRGPLSARRALDIIPLELVVHGWDIATATGRAFTVDGQTVAYLADAARDIVPDRRGVAYGDEVPAPSGATPLEELIAFTGRRLPA